jgi:hypothetical protein
MDTDQDIDLGHFLAESDEFEKAEERQRAAFIERLKGAGWKPRVLATLKSAPATTTTEIMRKIDGLCLVGEVSEEIATWIVLTTWEARGRSATAAATEEAAIQKKAVAAESEARAVEAAAKVGNLSNRQQAEIIYKKGETGLAAETIRKKLGKKARYIILDAYVAIWGASDGRAPLPALRACPAVLARQPLCIPKPTPPSRRPMSS